MSYSAIWTHANDETFQGRCWAALWDISNKVVAGDEGYPAAGQAAANGAEDVAFANSILKDESRITGRQLAQQVLRNATIATNPGAAVDSDLAWQTNNAAWSVLRGIS